MSYRKIIRWLFLAMAATLLVVTLYAFNSPSVTPNEISISKVASRVKDGHIDTISVGSDGRELTIRNKDGSESLSSISGVSSLEEVLANYGIDAGVYTESETTITYLQRSRGLALLAPIFSLIPALLIIGFFYYMYRQNQGTTNQAASFGKSTARLFTGESSNITFDDVAGVQEAKEELKEVVEFLREPDKFTSFGARIPRGVLLVGSPGTGKTLLAKAVAGEAGVPFFSIAGSEFVEMFVGVGASRVRDLFEQAKRHSPCIIFIDEIDAVGRQRGAGLGGGHDEREQTLNQILVEMDGFSTDAHIIMLAATNRPDILDPALMRPGRFDRRVMIDRPDIQGREKIFGVHMRGKPFSKHVNVELLARATPGFSGADIENAVNEAAILAARRNRPNINMTEMQDAIERVQLGPERKSRVISQEERELTAYHEAGHAVVAHYLPNALPLRKVTIVPRGMAGGVTWFMEDDTHSLSRSRCNAFIAVALGGRVAEEIIFGEVTTGASDDLNRVTKIAQDMVTRYGMSDKLGLRVYGERQEMVFLGREISEQRNYSDAIAEMIDLEIRAIVDAAHVTAHQILAEHKDKLELIALKLLDVETLNLDQFAALIDGRPMPKARTTTQKKDNSAENPPSQNKNSGRQLPPAPAPA